MNEVRNVIVGFDFGEKGSQVTYYDRRAGEPISLSVKVGSGEYIFPNCLSKKQGEDVWHFGPEVSYFAEHQEETPVYDLYQICKERQRVEIQGRKYTPGQLLGIFLQKSLGILGLPDPMKSISSMMITTPVLTRVMVENIREAMEQAGFPKDRCFLQDYEESFYCHTLYQRSELWSRSVALFTFDHLQVSYSYLIVDKRENLSVVQIHQGKKVSLPKKLENRDVEFAKFVKNSMGSKVFSSIYIAGEGFDRSWAEEHSIPLLCRHQRHVFHGANLFSKGACFGAKEKVEEKRLKGSLFVGSDMVKTNIGMEMTAAGVQVYYPIIRGGVNWYEALGECEIILDDVKELVFLLTDLEGTKKKKYIMPLKELPERPSKATRLQLHLEFVSRKECVVKVTDLGFGELYPSSGRVWQESIKN